MEGIAPGSSLEPKEEAVAALGIGSWSWTKWRSRSCVVEVQPQGLHGPKQWDQIRTPGSHPCLGSSVGSLSLHSQSLARGCALGVSAGNAAFSGECLHLITVTASLTPSAPSPHPHPICTSLSWPPWKPAPPLLMSLQFHEPPCEVSQLIPHFPLAAPSLLAPKPCIAYPESAEGTGGGEPQPGCPAWTRAEALSNGINPSIHALR